MSTIGHKAEAVAELDAILLHFDEDKNSTARATMALTHSTLALVEAQQTANLIAYNAQTPRSLEVEARIERALGLS